MATEKQQRSRREKKNISNIINQQSFYYRLDGEAKMIMKCLVKWDHCCKGSFLLKNFMLSRLRAAIDINDVLHSALLSISLCADFSFFKLKATQLSRLCSCFWPRCAHWNHDQTVLVCCISRFTFASFTKTKKTLAPYWE
jgi:hypothetical protein